jgi:lambda repressor-like predicted transcriptional regulator
MHPEQIKAAMRMAGVTPAALADEMGLTRPSITSVINGKQTSARVKAKVAAIVGKPIDVIWPKGKPSTLRRQKPATNS